MRQKKLHTILAFAHNQPGVLYKLLSLIRKKRYNVETITVGHTHVEGISRMTISFSHGEGNKIEQIVQQIAKITADFYEQEAVMFYLLSEKVFIRHFGGKK